MIKKLKSINESLPALLLGIIIYGVICQIVFIWFVSNRLYFSIGLWVGIMAAIGMAYHMAWTLSIAVDIGQKGAESMIRKHSLLRYGLIVLLLVVLLITNRANLLATFLGIMGLKVSAYIQPLTYKIMTRR